MLANSVQSSIKTTIPCPFSDAHSKKICISSSVPLEPKSINLHSLSSPDLNTKRRIRRNRKTLPAAAAAELAPSETTSLASDSEPAEESQLLEEEVKSFPKPRLVLKFIWMEKNIGLGLDQLLPGYGTVPLSPYFFWPRKDAWEELKNTLESKPWISQKKMIILLNQATDIINLWQQSGRNLT
ncbi:30S ribosomal protein 3-1- chloroplastic [Striga hermonthica]|uniref:30S ribosomal protein 3-1- chloroplastic n=1 Tax=Striga hermonthica TaxID=68872 RepID=A0A9N7RAB5_STRHE|nr:30S ribosomal protein 3-1- chloroplastic [Striga hermonthica]